MSYSPDEFDLPEPLKAKLRQEYGRTPAVPPTVDAAILNAARGRLRRFRPARMLMIWGGGAVTAAAAALAIVMLLRQPELPPAMSVMSVRDLNRDGRVNMLDAYVLARRAEAGAPLDGALDLNGDGKVDRLDADVIANDSVRLGGQGSGFGVQQGDNP